MGRIMMLLVVVVSMATVQVVASANVTTRGPIVVWANHSRPTTNQPTGSSSGAITDLSPSKSSSSSQSSSGSQTGSKATNTKKPSASSRAAHRSSAPVPTNGSLMGRSRMPRTAQPSPTVPRTSSPRKPVPKHAVVNPNAGSHEEEETEATSADSVTKRNTAVICGVILAWITALFCALVFSRLLRRHLDSKKQLDEAEEPSSDSPMAAEDSTKTPRSSSYLRIVDRPQTILQCGIECDPNNPQHNLKARVGSIVFKDEVCDAIDAGNLRNLARCSSSAGSQTNLENLALIDADNLRNFAVSSGSASPHTNLASSDGSHLRNFTLTSLENSTSNGTDHLRNFAVSSGSASPPTDLASSDGSHLRNFTLTKLENPDSSDAGHLRNFALSNCSASPHTSLDNLIFIDNNADLAVRSSSISPRTSLDNMGSFNDGNLAIGSSSVCSHSILDNLASSDANHLSNLSVSSNLVRSQADLETLISVEVRDPIETENPRISVASSSDSYGSVENLPSFDSAMNSLLENLSVTPTDSNKNASPDEHDTVDIHAIHSPPFVLLTSKTEL